MARIRMTEGALLCPVPPALITCGSFEHPNVMTAAWTGIINTKPPRAYVSIRPERYSHGLISASGELVINLTTESLVKAADFCGVRSGRDVDKFEKCGFTKERSLEVSAPTLGESPLSLECRVFDVRGMGSHDLFLLDIVAVTVREELLDADGRLALEKSGLAAYAHGEYFALGKKLGSFGYSVRRKKKKSASPKPAKSPEQNARNTGAARRESKKTPGEKSPKKPQKQTSRS